MKAGIKILYLFMIAGWFLVSCASSHKAYLFTSFHEPATDGLRMLYSYDGYRWTNLNSIFIKPEVGIQKVMRDPSMIQGPDGIFRLVWTSDWSGGNGFGYASSKDLIHWSKEVYLPVMKQESTVVNVWAPELFYDETTRQYIIVWASCIPNRFPKGLEDENNNHRLYYTTTTNFVTFTETKLFYDPGFSSIDAQIVKMTKGKYVLVVKDNTRLQRNIKVAFASSPLGPYSAASAAFTESFTEGPAVTKVKDNQYLIYYDAYREKKYGARKTSDFIHFTDASKEIDVPQGHKHGTILRVSKQTLKKLLAATTENNK
jgi:hypothetical protein